jgi:hypothetical protein
MTIKRQTCLFFDGHLEIQSVKTITVETKEL